MKHKNNNNKMMKIYKDLTKKGFDIKKTTKGYKIIHNTGKMYIVHESGKMYHPLRRWLKSNFDIII